MFPTILFTLSILTCQVTASSSISWLQPQRSAIVKLDTPGYPLWVPHEIDTPPTRESSALSAVLLNLTMSADNKTLFLNHKAILPLQNYNVPPRIAAYQVPADMTASIASMAEDNYKRQQSGQVTRGRLLELDYDRLVEADPAGGPPFYKHSPTLRFRIMGLGVEGRDGVLDVKKQEVLHVSLQDENGGKSDDAKRSYAITKIKIKNVEESYNEVHKGPEADQESDCTNWSWTCPDDGMYEIQSRYHRFIWRRKFDEFGRIGSLRHRIFSEVDVLKQKALDDPRTAIFTAVVILLTSALAVVGVKSLLTLCYGILPSASTAPAHDHAESSDDETDNITSYYNEVIGTNASQANDEAAAVPFNSDKLFEWVDQS